MYVCIDFEEYIGYVNQENINSKNDVNNGSFFFFYFQEDTLDFLKIILPGYQEIYKVRRRKMFH